MSTLVIDLEEARALARHVGGCRQCQWSHGITVVDTSWSVGLLHDPNCPKSPEDGGR